MSVLEVTAPPIRRVHSQWRFPTLVGAVALVTTSVPSLVGWYVARSNRQFMGIVSDVPDTAQYLAWMRASAVAPGIFIANPLTPEPNHAVFFNLLWFTLGKLSLLLHAAPITLYQGFRWVASIAFLAAVWWMCGFFGRPGWERQLAFLLVVCGGGFGWLWVVLKHLTHNPVPPLDIYIAEPNTPFSLIAFPHLLLASALLIGVFLACLSGYETGNWRMYLIAAALALVIGVTHAYDLLIVGMVLGGFVLAVALRHRAIPWRLMAGCALIGVVASPPALYFAILTTRDPTWSGVLAQYGNAGIVTPTPLHLLILLGPIFIVAFVTHAIPRGWRIIARGPDRDVLLLVWFFGTFALAYLPTSYQIKMLVGWQIPAGILAARGIMRVIVPALSHARLGRIASASAQRLGVVAGLCLFLLAMPTSLYLVAWRAAELRHAAAPYSIVADDRAALNWLGAHATRDDVVLASLTIGQYVAAESDARPVLAHWAQTLQFYDKTDTVRRFYDRTTSDDERHRIIQQWQVRYVLVGPEERALGGIAPESFAGYRVSFASGQTTIYDVSIPAVAASTWKGRNA